jgi:glycosyltransferase involved in cell wall biosynthesis
MRIAVYTIALNEEKHVKKWYESAKEADYLLIADTGSTDKTVEIAKSLGINVINIRIDPWRFDDARNASLAAIPLDIDYCIALDMDEVLIQGWKKDFPKVLELGITRPVYE